MVRDTRSHRFKALRQLNGVMGWVSSLVSIVGRVRVRAVNGVRKLRVIRDIDRMNRRGTEVTRGIDRMNR